MSTNSAKIMVSLKSFSSLVINLLALGFVNTYVGWNGIFRVCQLLPMSTTDQNFEMVANYLIRHLFYISISQYRTVL